MVQLERSKWFGTENDRPQTHIATLCIKAQLVGARVSSVNC